MWTKKSASGGVYPNHWIIYPNGGGCNAKAVFFWGAGGDLPSSPVAVVEPSPQSRAFQVSEQQVLQKTGFFF